MDTSALKKFAQNARTALLEQVASKLTLVLKPESAARREVPNTVNQLDKALCELGKTTLIDQIAYTWFNRFCALRFMDVNGYNRVGVLSPAEGQHQPEILAEAKAGMIDDAMVLGQTRKKVFGLLNGTIQSPDGQAEAYRLLIVSVCNAYYAVMPFLFEQIQDYTELLMPDDLLSSNSILADIREVMTEDSCQDVEVIGWLYQFYISEKKDEVFAGLKKNQKITAENIPAATQLFTPHWIVRYLVENSLGRLWLLNNPKSKLAEKMDYYISPEESEKEFLRVSRPEEFRICDPACGSGHMLTYAFDLLYSIYEEEGYDPTEIPALILTNNLYGIEIDERAGALAAFALVMKVADKMGRRLFLRMGVTPNISVLQNIALKESELQDYMDEIGRDLFTADLRETLGQFEHAKNYGSLIVPKLRDPAKTIRAIVYKNFRGNLFMSDVHARVLAVLRMADVLSQKYHVVVANPPYLGGKGMNGQMATWLKDHYTDVKSDLFSAFMVRNTKLTLTKGHLGFMTPFVWMFISSYKKLRTFLLEQKTITSLVQLEYSGFDGATVPICTFTFQNNHHPESRGGYIRLTDFRGSTYQAPKTLEAIQNPASDWFYRASAADFHKIPGSPIVYWASKTILNLFQSCDVLATKLVTREGLTTGSNELFLRHWHEVQLEKIGFGIENNKEAIECRKRYFTYVKGGDFRRWSGNFEYVVNWFNDGDELKSFKDPTTGRIRSHNYNGDYAFKAGFTWSGISSGTFAVRSVPSGFMFDAKGPMGFAQDLSDQSIHEAFLNSAVANHLITMLAPTLDFKLGHILNLPVLITNSTRICRISKSAILLSSSDWSAFETSWEFSALPLLSAEHRAETLEGTYSSLRIHWRSMTDEMQRLEVENNRIFIDAYGLQDELTPEVPLKDITLTCNPAYRYGGKMSEEALEKRMRTDTVAEFLSYAVGCMFGRYSNDTPGLILANHGETLANFLDKVPQPTFIADDDNVIPLIDFEGDWFEDDIKERFKQFLKVTFGEQHFGENLSFIEESLGKDIHKYFVKDFYSDHVKRYKKRPIYWLFSSSKGTFNALIYLHRYRPDTVSVVLNDYLREFRTKLQARKDINVQIGIRTSSSQKEKTQALKMIDKINKAIGEVNEYEREVLYPLAARNLVIDLDDGVKHNYPLFDGALKKITGLS